MTKSLPKDYVFLFFIVVAVNACQDLATLSTCFQGFLEGLNTCSTFFSETNVELDKMARRAEAAEDALDGSEVRNRIFAKLSNVAKHLNVLT